MVSNNQQTIIVQEETISANSASIVANQADIEEFSYQIAKIANVKGTFFYFYTPDGSQPDTDRELYLERPERQRLPRALREES
mgnify:CR=1 FL=1